MTTSKKANIYPMAIEQAIAIINQKQACIVNGRDRTTKKDKCKTWYMYVCIKQRYDPFHTS